MITPEQLQRLQAALPDDPAKDSPFAADLRALLRDFATLAMTMPSFQALMELWGEALGGLAGATGA